MGLGPKRTVGEGIDRRVPRNAPALFNLGANDIRVLFHDGRLSHSDLYQNGFNSPAEEKLPADLENILAAQALFPMQSETEMAGHPEENQVAGAVNDDVRHAWRILAKRVRVNDDYAAMLVGAFGLEHRGEITISHVANAIGAFIGAEWRSFDSPWDRFLAGEPLPAAAERGRRLFFGEAGCASCHAGKFFSDHDFRALALPQFGPGRTRRWDPIARDVGRMGESDDLDDAYRFRTPMLRNVALTGPYGHNGAYQTLEGMIRHHLNPVERLADWDKTNPIMPAASLGTPDFISFEDRIERARLASKVDIDLPPRTDAEIADLVAFLNALTGGESVKGRLGRPDAVPSGLPVD